MKKIYAIQPYEVGSKKYQCYALIIPSEVKRKCNIDKSSIFNLKVDEKKKQILLIGPIPEQFFENVESKDRRLISYDSSNQNQPIPLGEQ